ncbi:hypothetical protein R70006_06210 [Paraburkholderia domus]|uniref:hypothetical protein n=1 Tax=Paraburkholderia domus TaxID=2793075 RepID=UPI001911C585|nr:hypothetical protein [Paraburkholderia domus]MBK5052842.1 hypothetical protein [Burkholderia sp. R-70006]CAE6821290.1 hypothetical protein R70006_06210 [Paraburkholderia domus]
MKPEDFPTLLATFPDGDAHRRTYFARAVHDFAAGLQAGEIPNPVWTEAKQDINNALRDAFSKQIGDRFFRGIDRSSTPDAVREIYFRSHPELHTIGSWNKRLANFKIEHPVVTAMRTFLAEVTPLGEASDRLKGMVKKRQPKPVEEHQTRFVPRPASEGSIRMVRGALESITQQAYDGLRDGFVNRYTQAVAKYLEGHKKGERPESPYAFYMSGNRTDWESYQITERCVDYTGRPTRDGGARRKPDADAIIADTAEKRATEIRDAFVVKNLRKLASIVDAKANLKTVSIVSFGVDLASLRGRLQLSFADGSRFDAQNSVVWSRSVHNTPFLRFPLTFHDVVMPDGAPLKQPSEEKMNSEFAGRYYGTVRAPASELDMLESLGLRLGAYDHALGAFPAEASHDALTKLAPFAADFTADLYLRAFKPITEMTGEELHAERRWHDWARSVGDRELARDAAAALPDLLAQIDALEKKDPFVKARALSQTGIDTGAEPA